MNLHNARFPLNNIAVWVEARGMRQRSIGVHLWVLNEGEPPDMVPMQSWRTRAYWQPSRFSWRPFQQAIDNLFRNGYVPPLCGKRSASRRPVAYAAGYAECNDCRAEARRRGMMTLTQQAALSQSSTYTALASESQAWAQAGRPDQWPQPTT